MTHNQISSPPEIWSTDDRPDIVVWSISSRRVFLIELTCPAEEGIEAAQLRKEGRYAPLCAHITDNTSWTPTLFTIEVGARGFVAHTVRRWIRKFGSSNRSATKLCKTLSIIVARCTYGIYLARNSTSWHPNRALVVYDQSSQSDSKLDTAPIEPRTQVPPKPQCHRPVDPPQSKAPKPLSPQHSCKTPMSKQARLARWSELQAELRATVPPSSPPPLRRHHRRRQFPARNLALFTIQEDTEYFFSPTRAHTNCRR